jgi:hypothetical protein
MAGATFDILFAGELMGDADPDEARRRLQQRFKLSDEAAARLFGGHTIAVKRGVDTATASRYRAVFRDAGALVQIRPVAAPYQPRPPTAEPAPTSDGRQELARSTPGGPRMTLASLESGPLEQPPVPKIREIDISHLSLVPGWDWTLEDCQPPSPPAKLPDISHLEILAPDPDTREALGKHRG